MTYRPTEYQVLKRILYVTKDFDLAVNGHQVNGIIQDSCLDAYEHLSEEDMHWIERESLKVQKKCRGLGEFGALELLAAIGNLITNEEK